MHLQALAAAGASLISSREADDVSEVFAAAIAALPDDDAQLPQLAATLPLARAGC